MTIAHLEIRQKLAAAKAALDAAENKAHTDRQPQIDAAAKMRTEYLESARRCAVLINQLGDEIGTDPNVIAAIDALNAVIDEARKAGAAPANWGTEADLLCCAATGLPMLHGDVVLGDPGDGVVILKSVVSAAIQIEGGQPLETYTIEVDADEEAEEEEETGHG